MNVLKSVDMALKANIYDGGRAVSRSFWTKDGARKTAGVLTPGAYSFSTAGEEKMEITGGFVDVRILPSEEWMHYEEGGTFSLSAGVSFEIRCDEIAEYVCSYFDKEDR